MVEKEKLIFCIKFGITGLVCLFYIFRMVNNISFYFKAKKDFNDITEAINNNNKLGETMPGSFDNPNSDLNQWNIKNDENRQKAGMLFSDKLKDMFYDTAYFGGVIGVIWLNFGSAF